MTVLVSQHIPKDLSRIFTDSRTMYCGSLQSKCRPPLGHTPLAQTHLTEPWARKRFKSAGVSRGRVNMKLALVYLELRMRLSKVLSWRQKQ